MKIKEYIKQAHDTAVEKGFYECEECGGAGEYYQKNPDCISCPEMGTCINYGCDMCCIPSKCDSCNGTGKDQNKNIGELLMLVVSELGEALEAHRCGRFADWAFMEAEVTYYLELWKPEARSKKEPEIRNKQFEKYIKDTLEDEIADVFIRLFDLCGYLGIDITNYIHTTTDCAENVAEALLDITEMICLFRRLQLDKRNENLDYFMFEIFRYLEHLCERHNIPIEKHIEAKMQYNKTRPKKHGKEY